MRDAFGGVFMIRLMLVFLFIYVCFTAISLNYAKAFRVKNYVIDFVEQQEIFSLDDLFTAGSESNPRLTKLDSIINRTKYNKECSNGNGKMDREPLEGVAYCYRGIVFEQVDQIGDTIVYNVHTYAGWNLGTLNLILTMGGINKNSVDSAVADGSWRISGEARVVKRNYKKK